jgi:hypothetical protein
VNHRQCFDQAAAEWDALEVEDTLVRLREIVTGMGIVPGAKVGEDKRDNEGGCKWECS